MKVITTEISDLVILEPKVFGDHRGYFFESFNLKTFEEKVVKTDFVQDNESKSSKGVLRGLHFQKPPFAQAKLVRCIQGKVLDVIVDIRVGSPTFGKHVAIELSEYNKRQLFIPRGFAHGYSVLSEETIFAYKVDNWYDTECDCGIIWNDPDLAIDWQLDDEEVKLSEKDLNLSRLKALESPFKYLR